MAPSGKNDWTTLTWDDLVEWAGERSVSRGQSYQRNKHVLNLVIAEDGRLLANVIGGELYVVAVRLDPPSSEGQRIHSQCTCPMGVACKHAVAVVADYLDAVAKNKIVPAGTPADPRWEELEHPAITGDDDAEDDVDSEDEDNNGLEEISTGRVSRKSSRRNLDDKIRQHINAKSQTELAHLVWSLTQRFPQLHEEFRERVALDEGHVDRLVTEARRELRWLTAEPAWVNSWTGQGHVPDYSRLIHRLERLLESGHPDAVVKLGREIIERGIEHVGQSNDEGETGEAFARCFPIVFKAVAESSLSPAQKLLFVIDAELQDDYGLIDDAVDIVIEQEFGPDVWSEVADELARRLSAKQKSGDDSRDYHRDQLSNCLADALVHANRSDEALALYEREARKTNSYERLVRFLIDQKRYEEAQRWAREGIEKTAAKLPGIASSLAQMLSDIAVIENRWPDVAAHSAWQFFDHPAQETFKKLIDAAAKAGCQDEVRGLALRFLETGTLPIRKNASRHDKRDDDAEWPLPIPAHIHALMASGSRYRSDGPHYGVLIDMAIAEKRQEDTLRWYDIMSAAKGNRNVDFRWSSRGEYADRVAQAVTHSHPQRALQIYHQRVNENLTHASKSAYETVVGYLRKIRPILKALNRENEWEQLLSSIRSRCHNRPKFMEMLDRLNGGTILETQGARRT